MSVYGVYSRTLSTLRAPLPPSWRLPAPVECRCCVPFGCRYSRPLSFRVLIYGYLPLRFKLINSFE